MVRWPDGRTDQADSYIVEGFATIEEVRAAEVQDRT
jgi:hypothetical protein